MSAHILFNTFNAGEFSPLLEVRTDVQKHRNGCRKLRNFIPRTFGGAHSRPGLVYRGSAKSPVPADVTRLIDFQFSETTSLILELGNLYIRFWKDGEPVSLTNATTWVLDAGLARKKGDYVKCSGVLFYALQDHNSISASEPQAGADWQDYWVEQSIYERPTPWTSAQLFEIQICQVNDVVRLTHPNVEPQKLTRLADNNWTLAPVDYTWPPFADLNITETTLTISATTGTSCTLTASDSVFLPGHVGGHFQIGHRRDTTSIDLQLFNPLFGKSWFTNKAYVTNDKVHHEGTYYSCIAGHTAAATSEPGSGATWGTYWSPSDGIEAWATAHAYDVGERVKVSSVVYICTVAHTSATGNRPSTGADWMTVWMVADSFTYLSESLRVIGEWQLFTYENWAGTLYLERSEDEGQTWDVLQTYIGNNDKNVNPSGTQDNEAMFRLRFVDTVLDDTTTPDGRATFEAIEPTVQGYVKVTAVNSVTEAIVDVIRPIHATSATKLWREGSWSDARGWPRTVSYFEQRIIYGGSRSHPRNIWGSAIGDFDHFRYATLDDAAFSYLLSGRANVIQWMTAQGSLMVGTLGDELVAVSPSQQTTITPTGVNIRPQSNFGSCYLPALLSNDVVLFVESDRRTLREFVYSFEKDGFVAQRMTLLAEHITRTGIVQMALAQKPEAIVWAVTGDGRLIGMTYERGQEVVAWHQHPTDGLVESVAVVSGVAPAADEVWVVVRRTKDGAPVRYLERMDPEHWNKVEDENQSYFICCDSAKAQEFEEPVSTVAGLDHLEGREVCVVVDGAVHANRTVEGGEIELQQPGSVVVVGLPFECILEPNELELPMPDGSIRGRMLRINRVALRLWKSLGCQVRHGPDTEWEEVYFRDTDMPMDAPVPMFTGNKEIYLDGRHSESMQLQIRQRQPLPLNVLSITAKLDVYGD